MVNALHCLLLITAETVTYLPRCFPGPVDAAYKAIDSLVRVDVELVDYSVNSVSEGIEALATTRVIIRPSGKLQAISDHASLGKVQRTFSGEAAERRGRGSRGQGLGC